MFEDFQTMKTHQIYQVERELRKRMQRTNSRIQNRSRTNRTMMNDDGEVISPSSRMGIRTINECTY